MKSVSQGAATTVWCATSPQLNEIGGVYCENVEIAELDKSEKNMSIESIEGEQVMHRGVMPYALDEGTSQKLWKLSEELTDLKFMI
ncbi:hypothetical protein [Chryseobacterium edaphi]|uniref:hypothetical protein n=1 Tax=Chryseobacterium edaphi TaxID=2976532 RepID=UPI0034A11630